MAGKLQISVIEARNVAALNNEPDFYVKLKLGATEVRTETAKQSSAPKFLKDFRLEVGAPETDFLQVNLLQVGPKGDVIIGSAERKISSLFNTRTIVEWFQLCGPDGDVTAELCTVLRYTPAGAPPSPSHSIASQKAKAEAINRTGARPSTKPAGSTRTRRSRSAKSGKPGKMQVPVPLAIAGGIIVGAVAFLWNKKPIFHEIQEGDTLCSIGICYNRSYKDLYKQNSTVIGENPDTIYPGDRIRIK